MPVVVVANPKGGVGKSTLSTNVAGYYASQGHPVILGDVDPQKSAHLWLSLRPATVAPIGRWDTDVDAPGWRSNPPRLSKGWTCPHPPLGLATTTTGMLPSWRRI